jgi:thiol-disulfide isomerase/thioredoxin
MSETPMPRTGALSLWWLLLLLPGALGLGWLVGQLPVPEGESKAPARKDEIMLAARSKPPRERSAPPQGAGAIEVRSTNPAPARVLRPTEEAPRAEFSQWTTLENAVTESQRNGKPVLIDFSADWCGPCRAMKREVFEDGARGQAVQTAVIPVSIVDRVREDGNNPPEIESLQQRYQVQAFPTLIVFSPASGRSVRSQGFGGPEATLAWITQAARAVR